MSQGHSLAFRFINYKQCRTSNMYIFNQQQHPYYYFPPKKKIHIIIDDKLTFYWLEDFDFIRL